MKLSSSPAGSPDNGILARLTHGRVGNSIRFAIAAALLAAASTAEATGRHHPSLNKPRGGQSTWNHRLGPNLKRIPFVPNIGPPAPIPLLNQNPEGTIQRFNELQEMPFP